jgi:acyl-CoA synthetase (NDP forming)
MPNAESDGLTALLAPRSIAVLGASESPRHGGEVLRSLRSAGFTGEIQPVNPRHAEVYGLRCHASLEAIGRPVDCVVIAVAREGVAEQLRAARAIGARGAVIVSGGWRETGAEGARLEAELATLAREGGIRCLGPNTIGFVNVAAGAACYAAPLPRGLRPGGIAAVTQSGTVCGALGGAARGIGYSHLISTGNETDLDTAEILGWLAEDPATRVIACFAEGIARPRAFLDGAARCAAAGKPVILLRAGLSAAGQRMAASHTGALAGSARVFQAFAARCGVVIVDSLDDMLAAAELCDAFAARIGPGGLAMMTHSGGEASMFLDRCAASGLTLPDLAPATLERLRAALPAIAAPGNPLDVTGIGAVDSEVFRASLDALLADPGVAMVACMQDVREGHWVLHQAARLAAEAARSQPKPVFLLSNTSRVFDPALDAILAEGGVKLVYGTDEAVRAAAAVLAQRRATPVLPPAPPVTPDAAALALLDTATDEAGAKKLIAHYGLPVTREVACADIPAALRAAAEIGYPVALKILSRDIAHKTEVGGVALGLATPGALADEAAAMLDRVRAAAPDARLGLLVQEMVSGAVAEMILGMTLDPHAGPAVLCGLGGIHAEILDDVAVAIAPVDEEVALAALRGLRCWPMLDGARGRPKADVRALAAAMAALSRAAHELSGHVRAIDMNPVAVLPTGHGLRVLDALVERCR